MDRLYVPPGGTRTDSKRSSTKATLKGDCPLKSSFAELFRSKSNTVASSSPSPTCTKALQEWRRVRGQNLVMPASLPRVAQILEETYGTFQLAFRAHSSDG